MSAPILALQLELVREFDRDPRGAHVARLLSEYAARESDWRKYALFRPDVYTRNLVARNEHFEMLILCWSEGQASPIHNHAGQNCWMGVLEGEIEEILFDAPSGPGPLTVRNSKTHVAGRVAFINDDIALHRVRPLPGTRGISLHLYSKPIDVCNIYDEATGRVVESSLVYHSIEGVVAGRSGAMARG